MSQPPLPFWGISATEMLQELDTAKDGLAADEARQWLARYGSNLLTPKKRSDVLALLVGQFKARSFSFLPRDCLLSYTILLTPSLF